MCRKIFKNLNVYTQALFIPCNKPTLSLFPLGSNETYFDKLPLVENTNRIKYKNGGNHYFPEGNLGIFITVKIADIKKNLELPNIPGM